MLLKFKAVDILLFIFIKKTILLIPIHCLQLSCYPALIPLKTLFLTLMDFKSLEHSLDFGFDSMFQPQIVL